MLASRINLSTCESGSVRGRVPPEHQRDGQEPYPSPYDVCLLDSSVSAFFVTQQPRVLLNIAVFFYSVGFGLCALFAWLENVPDVNHFEQPS